MITKFEAVLMMAVLTAFAASGQTEGVGPGQPSVTVLDTLEVQGTSWGARSRARLTRTGHGSSASLVDGQGMARAAIIDFGGFLGVGSRKIAVAWQALHFVPQAEKRYGIVLSTDA